MIGVFDSGYGGLSVYKNISDNLPSYDLMYLGDNARAPYGNKSPKQILKHSIEGLDFLFTQGCELVIFACNTISSGALRNIQKRYLPARYPDKKVLGILVPAAESVFEGYYSKTIGIIGTTATIKSGAYIRELKKIDIKVEIESLACPLLVEIVEKGFNKDEVVNSVIKKSLGKFDGKDLDAIILGCTHFSFLKKQIDLHFNYKVKVIDPSEIIGEKLKKYLQKHQYIKEKISKNNKRILFTTGSKEEFDKFLKEKMGSWRSKRINIT